MKKEFKGQLKGFPKEVVDKMTEYQVEQGNQKDITVFERDKGYRLEDGGFNSEATNDGWDFWYKILLNDDFPLFFERYPKEKTKGSTCLDKAVKEVDCMEFSDKEEKPFPKLMKSTTSGRIIFFKKPGKGTVVYEKDNVFKHGLGCKDTRWDMNHFEDYEIKDIE